MTTDKTWDLLNHFAGTWTTEATHPAMPGVVVRGTAIVEWLEGNRFLIHRARNDHADFPDSISILGFTQSDRVTPGARAVSTAADERSMRMHYYDSRGVFRDYEASIDEAALRFQLLAPGFAQRFTGTFVDGGDIIDGQWQLCADHRHWHDDLKITYRRRR